MSANWAYRQLVADIKPRLAELRGDYYSSWSSTSTTPRHISGDAAIAFLQSQLDDLVDWISCTKGVVWEDFERVLDPYSKSTSKAQVKALSDQYCALMTRLTDWERKNAQAKDPTGRWNPVFAKLQGTTEQFFLDLFNLPQRITEALDGTLGDEATLAVNFAPPRTLDHELRELIQAATATTTPQSFSSSKHTTLKVAAILALIAAFR